MNIEYVLKHTKVVLWGIMIAFLAHIFFTATAQAQEVEVPPESSFAQRVEALSSSLEAVGTAIQTSAALSVEERIQLLTQLVDLSRAIVAARQLAVTQSDAQSPVDEVTLEDVGVHRVLVEFDLDSYQAQVTEYRLADFDDLQQPLSVEYEREVRTLRLQRPEDNLDFRAAAQDAKSQVVEHLMQEYALTDEVTTVGQVFISASNPSLNTSRVTQNTPAAYELLENFGAYSVVTNVNVSTDNGYSQINVVTDQDEVVRLTLVRDDYGYIRPDGDGNNFFAPSGDEYAYSFEFFVADAGDFIRAITGREEDDDEIISKVNEGVTGVQKSEALDFFNNLFAEIPFTGQLRQADEALFSFLHENNAVFEANDNGSSSVQPECIDRGDRLIVDEYILQLLAGLGTNYIIDELEITYAVPVIAEDRDGFFRPRCRGVVEHF